MLKPELHHFERAAREVSKHGDNDTLPFDMDVRFCGDEAEALATIAYGFYAERIADSGTAYGLDTQRPAVDFLLRQRHIHCRGVSQSNSSAIRTGRTSTRSRTESGQCAEPVRRRPMVHDLAESQGDAWVYTNGLGSLWIRSRVGLEFTQRRRVTADDV